MGDHLGMMASAVVSHQGIVNKFLGDGMLAFFRGEAGATNAVLTAFQIVEGFERLREAWGEITSFSLDFLDIGIGITTDDEIILGRIGDERFMELTVVGVGVNLAASLQEAARDGKRVICDHQTLRCLVDKSIVLAEGPTRFELRNAGSPAGMFFQTYHLKQAESRTASHIGTGPFDVFLSYRREGGSGVARALQQGLRKEYKVFLDVDKIREGQFDTALLKTIEATPNFLVVLSPGAFDRCRSPDDWMRQEIRCAIRAGRNIVAVALEGFRHPAPMDLPDDMRDVLRYDTIEYSHRYFDAMLSSVRERLGTPLIHSNTSP